MAVPVMMIISTQFFLIKTSELDKISVNIVLLDLICDKTALGPVLQLQQCQF